MMYDTSQECDFDRRAERKKECRLLSSIYICGGNCDREQLPVGRGRNASASRAYCEPSNK